MLSRSKETVADFLEYDEDSYLAPVEPGPPPELDTFEAPGPGPVEEQQTQVLEAPTPLTRVVPPPPPAPIGGRDLGDGYADIAVEGQLGPSGPACVDGRRARRWSIPRVSFPRFSSPSRPKPSVQAAGTLSLPSIGMVAARRGRTVALAALGGTVCTVVVLVALSLGRGTPEGPDPLAAKATAAGQPTPADVPSRRLAEPAERRQAAARQLRRARVRRASRRRAAKRSKRRGARSAHKLATTPAPVPTNVPAAPPAAGLRPTPDPPPPAAPRSVAEAEFGIEGR